MAMGLPFEGEKGPETRAGAVADPAVPTCDLDDEVGQVAARIESSGTGLCVVVHDGYVMGLLEGDALTDGSGAKTAADAMSPGPSTFRPSVPKEELAAYLDDHDLDRTLITTHEGRLVGIVSRADLGP